MLLKKLNNFCTNRIKIVGAPYLSFGVFGILNYPLSYLFYTYYNENNNYESVLSRVIATILCLILTFHKYWPEKLKPYRPLYWHLTVLYCLPLIGTFLLLKNHFSNEWLMNDVLGMFLLILIIDWLMFIILLILGIILGLSIFLASGGQIYFIAGGIQITIAFYMYLFAIIIGGIFSRNRELLTIERAKNSKKIENINLELEKKVLIRTEELEEALAVKTEFLNNMSHEIRTPIQGVVGISEGLVEHWQKFDNDKRFELAASIARNAKRLYSLVGNLLDLSKFSLGKMIITKEELSLNQLIDEMIEECNSLYMTNKRIFIQFASSKIIYVFADRERIIQVLRNLCFNSIKFSPENSIINIQLKQIIVGGDKHIQFIIEDEGPGIPENELEVIFSPFTQSSKTKTKAGGTGLGLAICKEIITAHRGKIWAESKNSKGSRINFTIPMLKAEDDNQQALYNFAKSGTILIIDDEQACLTSMELLLLGSNYKLIKATNVKEGIDYLKNNVNSIQLILLDLMMPDIYGLNLLKDLKADSRFKIIQIILQTGSSDTVELDKAKALGAADFIKKPYNKAIILSLINKHLLDNSK